MGFTEWFTSNSNSDNTPPGEIEIPFREHRVEFVTGDVRKYYTSDHELNEGFIILRDITEIWKYDIYCDRYECEIVKTLGNIVEHDDEEIGVDSFSLEKDFGGGALYQFEQRDFRS